MSIVSQPPRINRGNHLFTHRGSCLFLQKLSVDPLWQSLISPPGSTGTIAFSCGGESWLLILSVVIINWLPQDQQRQLPSHVEVKVSCWSSVLWLLIPQHDQQTETINRFWAKVGKQFSMFCLPEDIPFGKVQLIRHKDKHCNLWAFTYQIMCSCMANCMLISVELQTLQLLLCAWITQMDLQETLCFRKFCDFPCTLCPEPWDLCALRHSVRSTGWPQVFHIFRKAYGF